VNPNELASSDGDAKRNSPGSPPAHSRWGDVLRAVLLAGSLVGAMGILHATPLGGKIALGNLAWIRQSLVPWGAWAWIVFAALGMGLVSIGFPRIVLAAVAGALFGALAGTALAQVAATLACAPAFFYCRLLGRDLVQRRLGDRFRRLDRLLQERCFLVVLLIRLCPVGNSFLTNCLAGVSSVPFGTFLAASFLGFLPENFIFALMGGGFAANFDLRLWSSLVLLLVFSLFFIWYFGRSELGGRVLEAMRKSRT
jgi:uncharacterized membrane protein YdjX (TVP38/TMEM64 family)